MLIFIHKLENMIGVNGIHSLISNILSGMYMTDSEFSCFIKSGILFGQGITAAILLLSMRNSVEKFEEILNYYTENGQTYQQILDLIIDYYSTELNGRGWKEIYSIVMYIIDVGQLNIKNIYENSNNDTRKFLDFIILGQV